MKNLSLKNIFTSPLSTGIAAGFTLTNIQTIIEAVKNHDYLTAGAWFAFALIGGLTKDANLPK